MHGLLSEDHLGFIELFDKLTLDVSIAGGVLEHLS
jgi:hypothetical protein